MITCLKPRIVLFHCYYHSLSFYLLVASASRLYRSSFNVITRLLIDFYIISLGIIREISPGKGEGKLGCEGAKRVLLKPLFEDMSIFSFKPGDLVDI